jgi:hypothetical protein
LCIFGEFIKREEICDLLSEITKSNRELCETQMVWGYDVWGALDLLGTMDLSIAFFVLI